MIYGYLLLAGFYLILFFLAGKEPLPEELLRQKESFPGEKIFLKAAAWCLRKKDQILERVNGKEAQGRFAMSRGKLGKSLKLLQPALPEKEQAEVFCIRRCSLVLLVVFLGSLTATGMSLSVKTGGILQEGNRISRNRYNQGKKEVVLSVHPEEEEKAEIRYTVAEQQYTEEELAKLYEEASARLPDLILGENPELGQVITNLELPGTVNGYPFQITWDSDAYSLVHTDGTVCNEALTNPEIVTLTAHFYYEETMFDQSIPLLICPAALTEEERWSREIETALEAQDQKSRTEQEMILPDRIGAKSVTWEEVREDNSGTFFVLTGIAALLVFAAKNRELEKKLTLREQELLSDYPEIANKLTVYMGAGMTIRNVFGKLGEDYKRQRSAGRKRYAYEEILLLCHELQSGVSETEAYTHFGKRCCIQPYRRLTALLSQNLRKGNSDLLLLLRQETEHAFEERKNNARKSGEEAGTKLLLPMMMMLCIVMVLIMIPAFFSFSA